MFRRFQQFKTLKRSSCFLWGPRQVGKSTLLANLFPQAQYINLLEPQIFRAYVTEPEKLKEHVLSQPHALTIIDEVQKIPTLLDVVQLLMDQHDRQFILTGSSARKLKRGGANLLGGRALRYELFPLCSVEIPNFDLLHALNHGLLPKMYLAENAIDLLDAYVGNYLSEEVFAEALTRNQQAFSQFLNMAAFSNGEIVNFSNIASDCGVKGVTVKEYFQILEDTLIGFFLPSFRKRPKRKVILSPKFYYFDVGLANHLLKRRQIEVGSDAFGRAFEHFIIQEIRAYLSYSRKDTSFCYWRLTSDIEIDIVLGDHEVAVEIKGSKNIGSQHLKPLREFHQEYKTKKSILVCLENQPRLTSDHIQILPVKIFLEKLWAGDII